MRIIDLAVALQASNRPSIIPLTLHFPMIIRENKLDELSEEWNDLPSFIEELQNLQKAEPVQF